MTTTQSTEARSCTYSAVHGGEQWCDTHDSAYPCPGSTIDDDLTCSDCFQSLEDSEYHCQQCGEHVDGLGECQSGCDA